VFPSEQILNSKQAAHPSPENRHKDINENSRQCCDELLEGGLHSTTDFVDLVLQPSPTISVHARELQTHAYPEIAGPHGRFRGYPFNTDSETKLYHRSHRERCRGV
jgi:hypothetical protein